MSTTTNLLPGTVLRFDRLSRRRNRQTGIRPTISTLVLIDTVHTAEDGTVSLASGVHVSRMDGETAYCTSTRHVLTARTVAAATLVREPVK